MPRDKNFKRLVRRRMGATGERYTAARARLLSSPSGAQPPGPNAVPTGQGGSAMYPFEKFTERSKHVLILAQEQAEAVKVSYIGAEHLLLALLLEKEGLASIALANLHVDIERVRTSIASILGAEEGKTTEQIQPTSRIRTVIERGFEEAAGEGLDYVGTEHLLIGILVVSDNIAAHVLEDLGTTLDAVRREVDRLRSEVAAPAPEIEPGSHHAGATPVAGDTPMPFDRLTEVAKKTLALAQEEAERGHTHYIGTQHMLLALLRAKSGAAFIVLDRMGASYDTAKLVIASLQAKTRPGASETVAPTNRVKAVLERAFGEAQRDDGGFVGTEHLLLGLLHESAGTAAKVLEGWNIDIDAVRGELAAVTNEARIAEGMPGD